MALLRPLYQQPAGGDPAIAYTAQQDRNALIRALISREGVIDYDSIAPVVRQRGAGANASFDVVAFRAAVVGDDVSDQGTYLIRNDAVLNVTGTPSPPASGTRRHRIIVRVRDKLHNGTWTTYDAAIAILPDTGSGTPAEPATAITLAFINQGVGETSITTAMIELAASRASVGSVDRTGSFDLNPVFGGVDATRPLKWAINADSRVILSGWRIRNSGSDTFGAGVQVPITDSTHFVPAEARPPGIRDFVLATFAGPVHGAIFPDGQIYVRYQASTPINNAQWWCSFDGATYLTT